MQINSNAVFLPWKIKARALDLVQKSVRNRFFSRGEDPSERIRQPINLLSSNCVAGLVYHSLHQQFNTPIINLYISSPDFVTCCESLLTVLAHKPTIVRENPYPILAIDGLTLHCVHYATGDSAVNAWTRRIKRFSDKNLHILLTDRDEFSDDLLERVAVLPFEKVLLSSKNYDYPFVVYYPEFRHCPSVFDVTTFYNISGNRLYNKYFDIYKWVSGVPLEETRR